MSESYSGERKIFIPEDEGVLDKQNLTDAETVARIKAVYVLKATSSLRSIKDHEARLVRILNIIETFAIGVNFKPGQITNIDKAVKGQKLYTDLGELVTAGHLIKVKDSGIGSQAIFQRVQKPLDIKPESQE